MDFQVTGGHFSFWKLVVLGNVYWTGTLKIFYHPKGTQGGPIVFTYALSPEGNRRRSNCFYLCLIVLGNVYWTFNSLAGFCLFVTLKMFYPPKGTCKAAIEGGPTLFAYVLFCVRKRKLDFLFTGGFLPF